LTTKRASARSSTAISTKGKSTKTDTISNDVTDTQIKEDTLSAKSIPSQKELKIEEPTPSVTNVKMSRKSSARASTSTKISATKSEDTDSTFTKRYF
jgi:hypothetical protein